MRCWYGLGIALLAAGATRAAEAQSNPKVYCLNSSSCYAAAFQFTDYLSGPTPYTVFSVYFQNLQGTFPASGPGSPLGMNWMQFLYTNAVAGPHFVDILTWSQSGVGNVREGKDQTFQNWSPPVGPSSYDIYDNHMYGVVGCNGPELSVSPEATFAWQTCPRNGLNGWAKFDFQMYKFDSVSDRVPLPVTWDDFTFSFGYGPHCTVTDDGISSNCQVLDYASSVTPEPATLALLATGLAGIGAAVRRRRRHAPSLRQSKTTASG